jgi:glucose-6-phosphate isomerase
MKAYWDGPLPEPRSRTIDEMRGVLADPRCTTDRPLYFMYRDLARTDDDRAVLSAQYIRYDMTVIPPAILCGEYVKTKGHYHPGTPEGPGYPELYQVLAGEAHYLLQHRRLDDIVVIEAGPGDAVIVPPDYGHITINPGTGTLVMVNLVSTRFSSEYEFFETMKGGGYYEYEGRRWERNPSYGDLPPLRAITPPEVPELGIRHGYPIYDLIGGDCGLDFLNHPGTYPDLLIL